MFHGTEGKRTRSGGRTYCGSFATPGYKTITNSDKTANLYTHATFDVSDDLQLYGDLLYNYEEQKYAVGSGFTFWGSSIDYGAFYDPDLDDFVNLQRAFAPEDLGGYQHTMNKQYENSYMLNLGARGTFGQSNWDYDLGFPLRRQAAPARLEPAGRADGRVLRVARTGAAARSRSLLRRLPGIHPGLRRALPADFGG
ncbi:hypothetical protein [Rhodanobacter lindaniclasticus]